MQRICVYAGSNSGVRPLYGEVARELGRELVARGLGLVYGGGQVGLMGVLADSVLAAGGEAIGIMPGALFPREVAHAGLSRLYEVGSMHERKALMADLADGFVALPGGFGTFDELFEIVTWAQLGLHRKPIGLLNVTGYYDPLLALVRHTVSEGFVKPVHARFVLSAQTPVALLDAFAGYTPPFPDEKREDVPER